MYTQVQFTGTRQRRMKVHVVVNGQQYRSVGYLAGKGDIVTLTDVEADILTGKTKPVLKDDGTIVTGFYVVGHLGEAGLTGESWELVDQTSDQVLAEAVEEAPKKKTTVKVEAQAPTETSG